MNYAFYKELFKELKNGIEILVGQAVFKLQIKKVKMLFLDQLLKNRLAYLNFDAIFEFLGQFTIRCIYYFPKRCWWFWDRAQNMLILKLFGVEGAVPP